MTKAASMNCSYLYSLSSLAITGDDDENMDCIIPSVF